MAGQSFLCWGWNTCSKLRPVSWLTPRIRRHRANIEIAIDGEVHIVVPDIARPDVAAFLGSSEAAQDFGWRLERELPDTDQQRRLEVCAVTAAQKRLLYYGYV